MSKETKYESVSRGNALPLELESVNHSQLKFSVRSWNRLKFTISFPFFSFYSRCSSRERFAFLLRANSTISSFCKLMSFEFYFLYTDTLFYTVGHLLSTRVYICPSLDAVICASLYTGRNSNKDRKMCAINLCKV